MTQPLITTEKSYPDESLERSSLSWIKVDCRQDQEHEKRSSPKSVLGPAHVATLPQVLGQGSQKYFRTFYNFRMYAKLSTSHESIELNCTAPFCTLARQLGVMRTIRQLSQLLTSSWAECSVKMCHVQ